MAGTAKRRRQSTTREPASHLVRPYVEAFVDPADYPAKDDARAEAHATWVRLCQAHNAQPGDVVRTPILNDYKYYAPTDFPFRDEDLWSPWP